MPACTAALETLSPAAVTRRCDSCERIRVASVVAVGIPPPLAPHAQSEPDAPDYPNATSGLVSLDGALLPASVLVMTRNL